MGFDLWGSGFEFNRNVWGWYPLWRDVHKYCDISDEDFVKGLYNNMDKISEETSTRISKKLNEIYCNQGLGYELESDLNDILEFSEFCQNSKGFVIG